MWHGHTSTLSFKHNCFVSSLHPAYPLLCPLTTLLTYSHHLSRKWAYLDDSTSSLTASYPLHPLSLCDSEMNQVHRDTKDFASLFILFGGARSEEAFQRRLEQDHPMWKWTWSISVNTFSLVDTAADWVGLPEQAKKQPILLLFLRILFLVTM